MLVFAAWRTVVRVLAIKEFGRTMAKDKKRGFFSWLGFGKEETPQQPAETQETEQLAPEHVETPAEVQAEEIVAITEKGGRGGESPVRAGSKRSAAAR